MTLAAGAAEAVLAQEPTPPPQEPRAQAPQPAIEQPTEPQAEQLVEQLGNEAFRERQKAERALRALGKDALPALRKAAEGQGIPEAQWRARRLIRQIEGEGAVLAPRQQDAPQAESDRPMRRRTRAFPGVPDDVQQRFDELFQSLESDFGMDIPRARFFDDSFFRDLQGQLEDMQQRLHKEPFGEGKKVSMHAGPDGVRVEVKTKNDTGEEETKVYEAPDLEAFHEKYPGVLDGSGIGGGFTFTMPNGGFRGFVQGMPQVRGLAPRFQAQPAQPAAPFDAVPPAHKRLGVTVRESVSDDLLRHLALDGALGVQAVQQGTLAESLDIQAGDLIVRIGDQAIANTQDVQRALGTIDAGQEVVVLVYRKGVALTLRATKPEPKPAAGAAPLQDRDRAGKIEPSDEGKR